MKEPTSANQYLTKDLGEAAALVTSGKRLLELRSDEGFYYFVFLDRPGCQELADLFWAGVLKVAARDYNTNIKVLKSRIYSRR